MLTPLIEKRLTNNHASVTSRITKCISGSGVIDTSLSLFYPEFTSVYRTGAKSVKFPNFETGSKPCSCGVLFKKIHGPFSD